VRYDETNIDTDAALVPLQARQQQEALVPPFAAVPGQLRSVAGQTGPDLSIATAAVLNGIAISFGAAGNILTFGITGIGTMAQRNAVAAITDVTTADATDLATVITLANDLKAKINQLLAAMRTANHLAP
jgi:hypothetical protein